jgi:hypothetical protein
MVGIPHSYGSPLALLVPALSTNLEMSNAITEKEIAAIANIIIDAAPIQEF